ncbi:anti-sigma factor [Sinorhizobium meliloti]|uniref:anti-sigma factor n=1 Tax=Rhizobium meliloti TaxID=382 RepID=UPI000FD74C6A|nr:anti-sigma factor [Sinorhizobium meliloti]RVH01061.1 anti-sigma factor [Sinorhizobium meliloti]
MTPAEEHEREPGGDEMFAAEYVLGVLSANERQIATRRIATDAEFSRTVDQWEERLSPLGLSYAEIEPPAAVKHALDQRLFGAEPQPISVLSGLWQSLAVWRGLAAAALVALAFVVVHSILRPPAEAPDFQLVASLAADDTDVRYLAVYDPVHSRIGLSHVSGARAPNRDFELWVIEAGQSPISAGIIPVGETVHLALQANVARLLEQDAAFAITVEPEGGSPTGQPTGPIVAAGDLKKI